MRYAALSIALLCAGCGPFTLSEGGTIPAGKSRDQAKLDSLICKDRARIESQTASAQARDFVLGFTLIGVPVAVEQQKADQRRIYKGCMEVQGYRIVLGSD